MPLPSKAPVASVASMLRWCQSSVDLDLTLGPLTLGEKGEKGEKDVGNLPVVGKTMEKP